MATNGPVSVQGCAYRITRLNQDGSHTPSSVTGMLQDDRSLVKLEAKPNLQNGIEITPISACGVPVISYKDCDRYKRWDVTLTLGDFDPEAFELIGQGQILTAAGTAGRTFTDGSLTLNSNLLGSTALAAFVASDVGRPVTDAGTPVASCSTTISTPNVTTTGSFTTSGIVAGMPVTGAGIPANTTVLSVQSATALTLSQNATATGAAVSLTFFSLPLNTYVSEYISATQVRMNNAALKTGTALSITLGAQPVGTIGYQYPHLLLTACPFGVSIEVWSKLIVRGTGYPGTTPYPSAGTPTIPGSAWVRTGIFRAFLWHDAFTIENKEHTPMWTGWAIENPNFGTGPNDDWRTSGLPGVGSALDTTAWCDMMCDFQLPTPLQPGYQAPPF